MGLGFLTEFISNKLGPALRQGLVHSSQGLEREKCSSSAKKIFQTNRAGRRDLEAVSRECRLQLKNNTSVILEQAVL